MDDLPVPTTEPHLVLKMRKINPEQWIAHVLAIAFTEYGRDDLFPLKSAYDRGRGPNVPQSETLLKGAGLPRTALGWAAFAAGLGYQAINVGDAMLYAGQYAGQYVGRKRLKGEPLGDEERQAAQRRRQLTQAAEPLHMDEERKHGGYATEGHMRGVETGKTSVFKTADGRREVRSWVMLT